MKSNPFATRYVYPGAVPWFCAERQNSRFLPNLLHRWRHELNCCGAIVGPHGSGKSTLLAHLGAELGAECYHSSPGSANRVANAQPAGIREDGNVVWLQLRRGSRPVGSWLRSREYWSTGKTLIVDGLEQLPVWCRAFVGGVTRWHEMGLLVSSHARVVGVPTLLETQVTSDLARRIVEHLAQQAEVAIPAAWVEDARLQRLLQEYGGNMRELLMRLFDDYYDRSASAADLASCVRG